MKAEQFYNWLIRNGYDSGTSKSRMTNCSKVSKHEGDLDLHFEKDGCEELLRKLIYSKADELTNNQPKHCIPITGNVYNGTAIYKQAVRLYLKFRNCADQESVNGTTVEYTLKKELCINPSQIKPIDTKDSYERFLNHFNIDKEEFYEFGIKETIFPEIDLVDKYWDSLKERVFNNGIVYIRGYGRDAKGTDFYLDMYKHLFKNENIKKDPTNNSVPQRLIQGLTGYKRNSNLFNYQVSHIYGRTKNIFLFESPWNLVLVPKLFDPLTGHETKGIWPKEYQEAFINRVNAKYAKYIMDYNNLIEDNKIIECVGEYVNNLKLTNGISKEVEQFEKDVIQQFQPITL